MGVRIAVLGPTRVWVDGDEIDLGGRKPAEVLALLTAERGRVVPADALAERLWRGDPPATAATTLQGHISRLRRRLDPDRGAATRPPVLVTRGDGYALDLPAEAVDADRFSTLVESGREEAARAPETGAQLLEQALALWTGEPYAVVADVPEVAPEVVRLQELRVAATEELAGAWLAAGRGAEVVPRLRALAAAHPLRERTHALLARALYRAGRQAEALDVVRILRERLAEELGLDPSPAVRDLEAALLRQDAALLVAPPEVVPAAVPGPVQASTSEDDGFVGRAAELTELAVAWQRAAAGRGTAVVVSGEPGMGKTRLLEVFARRAGAPVRWGRCPESAGAPPYWPWQQVLGGLPETLGDSDPGARFALALEVTARLRALAAGQPLLVVLDDLQWADADSLHVLENVLAELGGTRLLLALTCREEPASAAVIATLARAARVDGARRLALSGLGSAEVAELVSTVTGREDPALAESVAARSAGNPFFATELAAHGSGTGGLPEGLRDVLRARTAGLGAEAADVLAAVAVAGREVALAHVAAALGRPAGDLVTGVERALAAGLVVERVLGRLDVAHDLVRDVVVADLGPGRRAALHAGLADAIEAGAGAATSAAAVAVHRSEAALGGTDRTAASACLRAAGEALDRAGDEEAAALAQRGLAHAASDPGDETRADLLHVLGVAQRRLGRLEASAAALEAEATIARTRQDSVRLARAALASAGGGVGGFWAIYAAVADGDPTLLEEAAETGETLPPPVLSSVLAALAVQRAANGYAAAELADRAEASAGDDAAARARAVVARYMTRWTSDHAAERLDLARRMLADSAGHPAYEATALHLLRVSLLENLRREETAAVDRHFREVVSRRGDGDLLLLDLWWRAGLALARGDYDEARRLGARAEDRTPAMSPAAADLSRTAASAIAGIVAWHEGRLPDLVPAMLDMSTIQPQYLVVVAQGHAQAGRREQALAAVDQLLSRPGAGAFAEVHGVLLADVYVAVGEVERAASLLPTLESWGDTMVVFWPGTTVLGPAALWRGEVLGLLGRVQEARGELRRALEVAEDFGFRPFADRARRSLQALG